MDSTIARVITSNVRDFCEAMSMRMIHELRVHVGLWPHHRAYEIFREDHMPVDVIFSVRQELLGLAQRKALDDDRG